MSDRPTHKWVIAGTVLIGTIMAVLDASIVNVALPDMSGSLGATINEITWVVTGYILANVIIMPIISLLSERFGRKRFYLVNIALFTVASVLCGFARTLPVMVGFRIVQGIGGGVLITISQAILRESFPPHEQGLAMGIYGMGVVLAPAIGPTLGGWLTDTYSWPWIFFINVPIGIVSMLLVARVIEDPPYFVARKVPLDLPGLALMTMGLGSLQLMLEKGAEKDWFESGMIITLATVAFVGIALFIWRELRTRHPAVDLSLMRNVQFSSATFLGGILGMGLYGSLFLLPLFLQRLLGYPAMQSGLAMMPRSLAMAVVMPLSGRLYNRLGARPLVAAGLLVSAFSFYQLSRMTADIGTRDLLFPQLWQGVGFGLIFVALSTAALSPVRREKVTAASGLYNVIRQIFGSVGVALAATELSTATTRYHARLAEHVSAYGMAASRWLMAVGGTLRGVLPTPGPASDRALALLDLEVRRQATVLAYDHAFFLTSLLFLISTPLAFFIAGKPSHGAPPGPSLAAD